MKKILLSLGFMGLIATGANAQGKLLVVHNSPDPLLATVDVWTEVAALGSYVKLADDVKYKDGYFYTIPSIPVPGANLVIHLKASNSTSSADPDLYSQTVTGIPTGNNLAIINGLTSALALIKTNPSGVSTSISVDFVSSGVQFSSANANQIQAAVHHGIVDADSIYAQSFITTIQQPSRDTLIKNAEFRTTGAYGAIPAAARRLHIIATGSPQTSPTYAANGDNLKTLGGKAAFLVSTGFSNLTGTGSTTNSIKLMAYVTDATTADGVLAPVEIPAEKIAGVVKVLHNAADPKVKAVDLYVGGMKQVLGLTYRNGFQSAGFIQDFDYNIGLNIKDSSSSVLTTLLRFDSDSVVAVVSGVVDTAMFTANPDAQDRRLNFFLKKPARMTQPAGSTMVTVFHGATDAPTVSLTYNLGGSQVDLISGLKYGEFQTASVTGIGTSLPTALGTIVADLRLPGGALYKSYLVPLGAIDGKAVTVCASGFVDSAANQNGSSFKLFIGIPSSPFPQIVFLKDTSIANSINDPSVADLGFRMFPNPVANELVMAFDVAKSTNVAIDIIDINGRVVKAVTNENFSNATNVKSVNTSELSSGLYFARVKSDTKTSVYKFNVVK
jgi:hypothetical protein